MKILIGLACSCVIGLTAMFALEQYVNYKYEQRVAIQEECYDTWNYKGTPEEKAKLDALTLDQKKAKLVEIRKCQDYAMNGYLPN